MNMLVSCAGGQGAACVEGNPNSQTSESDYWLVGSASTNVYVNSSYVAAGTGTYTVKTLYVKLRKIGTPNYTMTFALCTSDGATPPQPSSCTDIGSISTGDVSADAYASYKLSYPTGYSQTNGTRYHIRVSTSGYGSGSDYIRWAGDPTFATAGSYASSDGSTWTAKDATFQHSFVLKNCVE
jgi:hypothetical protein